MMQLSFVPLIMALSYLFCEGLKGTRLPTRLLPFFACLFGGVLGVLLYFFCPVLLPAGGNLGDALLSGLGSGLSATGAYEAIVQLFMKKNEKK